VLRQSYLQQHQDGINTKITTTAAAKKALKANHLAGYLTLSTSGAHLRGDYHGNKAMANGLKAQVQNFLTQYQTIQNYQTAKLSPKQKQALAQTPVLKQHVATKDGATNLAKIISFWILITMIYIILITYSTITAQEIASDKGTKIMEIIFSSTTATSYFVGKILGILLVIVTQIAIYLLGGWAGYGLAMHNAGIKRLISTNQSLVDSVIHNIVNLNLLYVLLGVVIYTLLAAYSGALVSKAEDASKAAQPVVMLGMLGFFAAFPFQNNLDALAVKILSYVPFFSSYFMPMRVINGTVSLVEQLGSLLVLLVTIGLFALYIGRQYQRLMLQTDSENMWQRLVDLYQNER